MGLGSYEELASNQEQQQKATEKEASILPTPSGAGQEVLNRATAAAQLAEIAQAKNTFINLISHELRTPLTSLSGALQLLNEPEVGPLNPVQEEFLQIALKNTCRLISLMEKMFEVAQLEMGQLQLQHEAVSLEVLLEQVLKPELRDRFAAKQISLKLNFEQAPLVRADAERLHQIFENLLSNACKFTLNQGEVVVRSLPDLEGRVRVYVSDDGIGISPADQEHISEKFFLSQYALNRAIGGVGLGLSITKALIELHGSRLEVKSWPGQGSCFSFVLPTVCGPHPVVVL